MYGLYFGILIILAIAACLVYVAVETFGKSTKKNRHG
jgi:hypothetical protein